LNERQDPFIFLLVDQRKLMNGLWWDNH
jgi:hypothetical protein